MRWPIRNLTITICQQGKNLEFERYGRRPCGSVEQGWRNLSKKLPDVV